MRCRTHQLILPLQHRRVCLCHNCSCRRRCIHIRHSLLCPDRVRTRSAQSMDLAASRKTTEVHPIYILSSHFVGPMMRIYLAASSTYQFHRSSVAMQDFVSILEWLGYAELPTIKMLHKEACTTEPIRPGDEWIDPVVASTATAEPMKIPGKATIPPETSAAELSTSITKNLRLATEPATHWQRN